MILFLLICFTFSELTFELHDNVLIITSGGLLSQGAISALFNLGLVKKVIFDTNSNTQIGPQAFFNFRNLESCKLSKHISYIDVQAFRFCFSLTKITIDIENQYYTVDNQVLYNKEKHAIYKVPVNMTEISLPSTVLIIKSHSFHYIKNMSKLLIPKTVTSIEGGAFYDSHIDTLEFEKDSQLTSLTTSSLQYIYSQRIILSNSLEEIQSNAIYSNSQHFNISFITPRTKILTIQSNGISDTSIETFAIPSGTTLKANALNPSNSLQSVTISENVHLEDNCFSGCPNIESFFILDNNIHFKDGFLTEGNKLIHISRSTSTSFDASSLSSIYFKR